MQPKDKDPEAKVSNIPQDTKCCVYSDAMVGRKTRSFHTTA